MIRIFNTMRVLERQEVTQDSETHLLALLRVKLNAKDIAAMNSGYEATCVWGNGGNVLVVIRVKRKTVDEVEVSTWGNPSKQRAVCLRFDLVPADVRDAFAGFRH